MPSMVSDVSAMFVEKMILRPGGSPGFRGGGAGSKMRRWRSIGSVEYSGSTQTSGTWSPTFSISAFVLRTASSISCSPVRKTRMSASGSHRWICTTVRIAASK